MKPEKGGDPTRQRHGARLLAPAAVCLLALIAAGALAACSGSPASGPQNTVDPGPLEPNGPISWSEAASRVGEVLPVQGPVTGTSVASNGDVVLNIGADAAAPNRFVVVIPKAALGKFPASPADSYDGQLVVATGRIVDQGGVATMVVRLPARLTTGP
jgi:hypothetical protein